MMMSVPWPSTRGPSTLSTALTMAITATNATLGRSVVRSRPRRRTATPKSFDFSVGIPAVFHRPAARVSGAARFGSFSWSSRSSTTVMSAAPEEEPSCRVLPLADLRLDDLRVGRAIPQELFVRAGADELPVVEHEDVVGGRDRRTALRHDHERGLARVRHERVAKAGVGREIEGGERVVEQVDLRLADEGA